MPVRTGEVNGNSYLGVFCKIVGSTILCPLDASPDFLALAESALGLRAVRTMLGGANLHGSLIASNSKGAILPYFISADELGRVLNVEGTEGGQETFRILSSDDPVTAWGNNVLVSEKVALISPELSKRSHKVVEDVLDVEPVVGTIAGIKTIGSIAVRNSKGMVVHPKAKASEMERLRELFGIDVQTSTANFGSPYLGACMVANDNGCLVGRTSSGVELNRIENTLDLF